MVFLNSAGDIVTYRLSGDVIERGCCTAGAPIFRGITGNNVSVRYLNFRLLGASEGDGWPPRVTMTIGVSAKEAGVSLKVTSLETTVSSRQVDT